MSRASRDQHYIIMAHLVGTRSTCMRRNVGAVLVNERGHVLSTGYNGRAAGLPHCIDKGYACSGATSASGTNLDGCEAIHAEQNALLQCRDVYTITHCYVTVSPCITCVKLLMNTSCQVIVFSEPYAHDEAAKKLWLESPANRQRFWIQLPLPENLT